MSATALAHGFTVVDGEHDLVIALLRHRAPHPDLVALVVAGDVGNDAFDIQAFAGAEVAPHFGCLGGCEDEPELFGEDERKGVGMGLVMGP